MPSTYRPLDQGLFKVVEGGFVGAGPRACPAGVPPTSRCANRAGTGTCPYDTRTSRCANRAGTGTCPYESVSSASSPTLNRPLRLTLLAWVSYNSEVDP